MRRSYLMLSLLVTGSLLVCAGCAEAQTPESVSLHVGGGEYTIVSDEDSLTYRDGFSGPMPILNQTELDIDSTDQHYLEVPFRQQFTYECLEGEQQKFGIAMLQNEEIREYSASGTGIQTITLDLSGAVSLSGEDMSFTIFLSVPCDSLGDKGCVRFYGTGEDTVSLAVKGDTLSFSGVDPASASLSYAGTVSNPYVALNLEKDSGTIRLTDVADGTLLVSSGLFNVKRIPCA